MTSSRSSKTTSKASEPSGTRYRLFASCSPGIESLLAGELSALGLTTRDQDRGGVELIASVEGLWRTCLSSRLAESVRVRLGRPFAAHNFEQLKQGLSRLPWAAFLPRGARPRVLVTCRRSALYHSDAVAERVSGVLRERLGDPPGDSEPRAPSVSVRIVGDRAQVSVDASGDRLHRRGYRTHVGRAPLRETLAAACLVAAGYTGREVLWDPFCGSGTILIEAARIAAGMAPGRQRRFAFQDWPTHVAEAYARWLSDLPEAVGPPATIYGGDRSDRELEAAAHNIDSAGVAAAVRLLPGDFTAQRSEVPQGAMIVTNLPYGRRTASSDLTETFRRFGGMLEAGGVALGDVYVLNGSRTFRRAAGLVWEVVLPFTNRGLAVELLKWLGPVD